MFVFCFDTRWLAEIDFYHITEDGLVVEEVFYCYG